MKIPDSIKTLFTQSILYFLAIGINRGLPVLLTPILSIILTPTEYGYLGIASIILSLLRTVIGLNPTLFVTTKFFSLSKENYTKFLSSIFYVMIVTFFIVLLLFITFSTFFDKQYELNYLLLLVISLTASFMVVESFILANFQMERKANLFLKCSFFSAALQFTLIMFFVSFLNLSWQGKLIADLLSSFIIAVILLIILRKSYKPRLTPPKKQIGEYVLFSLPLLPHSMSIWAMNFVDRLIIEYIAGISEVGQYTVAYNLGLGLSLIFEAAQRVWQPYFYENIKKEDPIIKAHIIKFTWIYFCSSFVLYGFSQLAIFYLFPYFVGENFLQALKFIPLIFLGYTFHGLYRAVASYLYYIEKTVYLMTITITTAIINVVLNIVLISKNGAIGAAQSTCITYFINYILVQIVVTKTYKMPWFTFQKIIKNS